MQQPAVLCPVDFSDGSRGAIRYAAAIAAHFGARLTLLAVNDPLLAEALDLAGGEPDLRGATIREVKRFFDESVPSPPHGLPSVHVEVATGRPAGEILRLSREQPCDLIVMSAHGASGFRKLFFGSTTERVLRDTTAPILVTPGHAPGPSTLEDVRRSVRRVLAPVDLTPATAQQVAVARAVAEAMSLPLLLLTVVEPLRGPMLAQWQLPSIDTERRSRAERKLEQLVGTLPSQVHPEGLVAYGETAEEIAKVATDRDAGLVVMGLHASPMQGSRLGSVTYRLLCLAHRLVLALPLSAVPRPALRTSEARSAPQPSLHPHAT